MKCVNCSDTIDPERIELLPKTVVCSECAQAAPGANTLLKGALIFNHKTGGDLYIFSSDREAELYQKAFRRVGQQSILRTVSPSKS